MKVFSVLVTFFYNFSLWGYTFVRCTVITRELCGSESSINLEPAGKASSVTVLLNPKDNKKTCKLNVTAPSSHVINLQWHEDDAKLLENSSTDNSPCTLSVFLSEDKKNPVWKGNPCMRNSLPEIDLLTPNLRLSWNPSKLGVNIDRKLVITAVGQDEVCIQRGQHVCMRIGWKPMLCVSEELACDGNLNCPKGSSRSDEDEKLCRHRPSDRDSWKKLAEEVIKKIPSEVANKKWLSKGQIAFTPPAHEINLMSWKDAEIHGVTTEEADFHPHHHDTGDSVSAAIAHYGTWGYLMLAMLIVGTILMFCGLWECCFRKPKPPLELQPQSPSTTVLIINRSDGAGRPPTYEELEQPPAYVTLFPSSKAESDPIIDVPQCGVEHSLYSNTSDSSDEQCDPCLDSDASNRSTTEADNERRKPLKLNRRWEYHKNAIKILSQTA